MESWMQSTADLAEGCAQLRREGVAALDTEFVWMRTYRAEMGIVQLADRSGSGGAFDCRAGADTAPLADLLEDADTVKILHAAPQDLFHLRHYCGARARNVFDTRLAAGFCGLGGGLGLAKLVQALVGVELPKTETRTDWTRRPLSPAQLAYAMDDVRYLGRMRDMLLERARSLGTDRWMAEEMADRERADDLEDVRPEDAWKRFRGTGRMDRRELAALRELAAVRERTAREWNLPRGWLGDDGSLEALARSASPSAPPRFRHRLKGRERLREMGEKYRDALAAAARLSPADWPELPVQRKKSPPTIDAAMAWLAARGAETGLDPEVVTSKSGLADFLNGAPGNRLESGWRWLAAGKELRERFAR